MRTEEAAEAEEEPAKPGPAARMHGPPNQYYFLNLFIFHRGKHNSRLCVRFMIVLRMHGQHGIFFFLLDMGSSLRFKTCTSVN